MKRRSIVRAYQNVRPDEEAKQRMLQNIRLSSEIPPAGKDERKNAKENEADGSGGDHCAGDYDDCNCFCNRGNRWMV